MIGVVFDNAAHAELNLKSAKQEVSAPLGVTCRNG